MREVKDTGRSTVRIGYEGRVYKTYKGPHAAARYENEVRVLKYLEKRGCEFVPRLLEYDPDHLSIVTTSCGMIVTEIGKEKVASVFGELEKYGVKHGDAFARNITYSGQLGRFCVIDFEFAEILETGEGLTLKETEK